VTSTGVPADNHSYTYTGLNQLKTDNRFGQKYDKTVTLAVYRGVDPASPSTPPPAPPPPRAPRSPSAPSPRARPPTGW
jgi:hypothetical protein